MLKNKNKKTGFTLIEVVIVVSLFLLITGASLGAFISVLQNQKRILSKQQFINQISYIEEYISKSMRMAKTASSNNLCGVPAGYIFSLINQDVATGLFRGIKFLNSDGNCQRLEWNTTTGVLEETNGATTVPLTSAGNFAITSIRFSANGSNGTDAGVSLTGGCNTPTTQCGLWSNDPVQPRITMLFNISIPGESEKIIQTTVSQRNLNLKTAFIATPEDVFPTGWSNYRSITISKLQVAEDLINYPVLVRLTGANFDFSKSVNGNDIRFTDVNKRYLLDYEKVSYDPAGFAELWVRIPRLSSSEDTTILMYYGNSSAWDGSNSASVWSEGYRGVWHANDIGPHAIADSSFYQNDGDKYADNYPAEVTGIVGSAQSFDGITDYIKMKDNPSLDTNSEFTISGWIKIPTTRKMGNNFLFGKWQDAADYRSEGMWFWSNGGGFDKPTLGTSYDGTWSDAYKLEGSTSLTANVWHYVTGVYNGSNMIIYLNGTQNGTKAGPASIAIKDSDFMIGAYLGLDVSNNLAYINYYKGVIDEVRLSDVARSSAWIKADYYYGGGTLACGTGISCVSVGAEFANEL